MEVEASLQIYVFYTCTFDKAFELYFHVFDDFFINSEEAKRSSYHGGDSQINIMKSSSSTDRLNNSFESNGTTASGTSPKVCYTCAYDLYFYLLTVRYNNYLRGREFRGNQKPRD